MLQSFVLNGSSNIKLINFIRLLETKKYLFHKITISKRELILIKTNAPVGRLYLIRMFPSSACYKKFKLHQMLVMNVLLNEFLKEDIFVKQPSEFKNEQFPNHIYKLKKYYKARGKLPGDGMKG